MSRAKRIEPVGDEGSAMSSDSDDGAASPSISMMFHPHRAICSMLSGFLRLALRHRGASMRSKGPLRSKLHAPGVLAALSRAVRKGRLWLTREVQSDRRESKFQDRDFDCAVKSSRGRSIAGGFLGPRDGLVQYA